jgi:hypothetical protein
MSTTAMAYYAAVATVIPVLFLAFGFQLGLSDLWRYEEPGYRIIFPWYVGAHGALAIAAEGAAVLALLQPVDNAATRLLTLAGIFVPMLYLVLVLVLKAREMKTGTNWTNVFNRPSGQPPRESG